MDPIVTRFVRIWVFDGSIFGVTVGLNVADIFVWCCGCAGESLLDVLWRMVSILVGVF